MGNSERSSELLVGKTLQLILVERISGDRTGGLETREERGVAGGGEGRGYETGERHPQEGRSEDRLEKLSDLGLENSGTWW